MKIVNGITVVQFGVRSCSNESQLFYTLNSYRCHSVQIEVENNDFFFLQQEIDVTFTAVCHLLCGMVWRHTAVSFCLVCNNTRLPLLIHRDIYGFV
jgi:hypothetical protein